MSYLQRDLGKRIDDATRCELDALIDAYRRGEQPRYAPLALLKHHFRRFPDEYLLNQSYLEPVPQFATLPEPL